MRKGKAMTTKPRTLTKQDILMMIRLLFAWGIASIAYLLWCLWWVLR